MPGEKSSRHEAPTARAEWPIKSLNRSAEINENIFVISRVIPVDKKRIINAIARNVKMKNFKFFFIQFV